MGDGKNAPSILQCEWQSFKAQYFPVRSLIDRPFDEGDIETAFMTAFSQCAWMISVMQNVRTPDETAKILLEEYRVWRENRRP